MEEPSLMSNLSRSALAVNAPVTEVPVPDYGGHVVQFYHDDNFLLEAVSRFVGPALACGDAAVVIATQAHRAGLEELLKSHGLDISKAARQGRYLTLDATEALSQIMVNGLPDPERFTNVIGSTLARAAAALTSKRSQLAAFGEMVNELWATGQYEAALRLEQLWNDLARSHSFSLLCAYPLPGFNSPKHTEPFLRICKEHSSVIPSESYVSLPTVKERLRNITELQQTAMVFEKGAALLRSEERFRLFVESVRDYAIFMLDTEGRVSTWNSGAERIKGYKAWEIVGKHFSVFYPEEDLRTRKPWRELEIAAKEGRFEDEGWRLRKDGSRFWANVIITALKDENGQLYGFGKVTRDFTDRMRNQEALQRANEQLAKEVQERTSAERKLYESEQSLRRLSLHLLRTQDEERRRIGRDLHDSLGQYLATLKINLDSLQLALLPNEGSHSQIAQCVSLAEEAIKEVRTISYLLYPPMLEELGLKSAIPWYLEGFTNRSGIKASLEIHPDFGRLPRDVELSLFRVLQESLTNVHRHSGSPTVIIRLGQENGAAILQIEDQGKGLPPAMLNGDGTGLPVSPGVGLRGMGERMRQLGGRVELCAGEKGAIVRAIVPVQQDRSPSAEPKEPVSVVERRNVRQPQPA
jgi:PAS domain S-box-containing protein